jgi:hypothetical protein
MKRRIKAAFAALAALFALTVHPTAHAVPGQMSVAARLSDEAGPVDGAVDVEFRIFDAEAGGTAIWSESHAGVPVSGGIMHASLGSTEALDPSLFDGSALFLEVTVDGDELSPRVALVTVPYAFHAAHADSADTLGTLTPDDVTYQAGAGLSRSGTTFSVKFGSSGSSENAARSNHSHNLTCVNVNSTSVTAAPGASNVSTDVSCGDQGIMTGGGCTVGTGVTVRFSRPSTTPNAWQCLVHNTSDTNKTVIANARCCSIAASN